VQEVQGKVVFEDGTPLREGTRITFWPTNSESVDYTISGTVVDGGEFEVYTSTSAGISRLGMPSGKYKVSIVVPDFLVGAPRAAAEFGDPKKTPLVDVQVPPPDGKPLTLKVKRAVKSKPGKA
jgi:hypothetical protein